MNAIDTNVWLYSHDTRGPLKQLTEEDRLLLEERLEQLAEAE